MVTVVRSTDDAGGHCVLRLLAVDVHEEGWHDPQKRSWAMYALCSTLTVLALMIVSHCSPADEDRFGPIALACLLAVAILVNFGVKLYDYST